jgi:hypothetical protein
MERTVRKLTIHTYGARIALCERMIRKLAWEFEGQSLALEQKSQIAHRMDRVLKEKHAFRFMLELLERQTIEENNPGSGTISSAV